MAPTQKTLDEYIENAVRRVEAGPPGFYRPLLVKSLKFACITFRELRDGQTALRAASLVYTTFLSLVPMLAVSFSVLKAFGVYNQARPLLAGFLAPLGPAGGEITERVMSFVSRMRVGVLGSVGLAMLIYTVISVISKMEDSLNHIWNVKRPRSLSRRFSDYMSVLLVGPILLFSAIGLTAAIKSAAIVTKVLSIGPLGAAFYFAGLLIPYITTCGAFTLVYLFIPAAAVRPRSALAGGLFAGISWEVMGWAFASFVSSSASYSAIYSGFAILILFMMWMYASWLVFLIGGSVSYYKQYPERLVLRREETAPGGRLKERLTLAVMFLVGRSFLGGGGVPCTLDSLARGLNTSPESVRAALTALEGRGLTAEAADGTSRYLPARDMDAITLAEVLDAARSDGEGVLPEGGQGAFPPEVERLAGEVEEAVRGALEGRTLKELLVSGSK